MKISSVGLSMFVFSATTYSTLLSSGISAFSYNRATNTARSFSRRSLVSLNAKGQGGKKNARPKKEKNAYAPTIILPETEFSQRANAKNREPEIQKFWKDIDLYNKVSKEAADNNAERYVLHDGPPYANGDLHIGHALNKLLKDFINRKQLLNGKQVHYVPGWDCHGLPIELKVLQNIKSSKERQSLTPIALREKAAGFAQSTVEKQSESFQRYGVFGDFDSPYLTLQPKFEAEQIKVFGEMYKKGYIFRGRKPVHWSPSSKTALAEAELEYPEGHISKSIYVAFEVEEVPEENTKLAPFKDGLKVAIWTTTPWTMPANMAVAVNPDLTYAVVEHEKTGRLLVADDLKENLAAKFNLPEGETFNTLVSLSGADLVGVKYNHPLYKGTREPAPVIAGGDYITTESGTGLVHTAPGHGQEDYITGLKYNLELLSPVDDVGRFTIEAGEEFVGKSVLGDGNAAVIEALNTTGALLKLEDYGHKYPYDWRTKKPTIFRATDQWFASVEDFRDNALDAIEKVRWVPEVGMNRIKAFVTGRGDWCISRQRSWGVPIPVFYDKATGKDVLLDEHTLDHIQAIFAEQGSDAWWKLDVVDLLPEMYKEEADKWVKGTDTMDVWFDSGSSWAGVANARDELAYPADLYLEGSDQHRGWFQSSLLTSVAAQGKAPYKAVLTHGFVLDEKGYKMSKSLGNVVDPLLVINGGNNQKLQPAYGADVLRLWVASSDYTGDVLIGDGIIKQTFESYRKLRNTARYLIGNLADFKPDGDDSNAIAYDDLPSLDKWMLGRLSATLKEVDEAIDEYQFNRATQELLRFSTADLSNFYLDVAKDRLYISSIDDYRRRSCQTVLHSVLEGLAKAMSPILPHMSEDIWQNLPYETQTESVFQGGWPKHLMEYTENDAEQWAKVRDLRDDVNKVMESARVDKLIGASLDAEAYVYIPDSETREIFNKLESDKNLISPPVKTNGVDDLRTVLLMSRVNLVDSAEEVEAACDEKYVAVGAESGFTVGVKKATGTKCGRCWFYDDEVGNHDLPHSDVCQRCNEAITSWEEKTGETFTLPVPEEAAPEKQPTA